MVEDLATDRDQDGLVVLDRADDVVAGDVIGGDDDHLRPVEARIELERIERRVRVGGADRRPVPRAGDDDVVRVERGPGQLLRAFASKRNSRARASRHGRADRDDERLGDGRPGRHARDDTIARRPDRPVPDRTHCDPT